MTRSRGRRGPFGYLLPFTPYPYAGEPVDCPVCGSADHEPIATWDRRWKRLCTSICNACGLLFTNPMPTEAELEAYYRSVYRRDYQFAFSRPGERHVRKKEAEAEARYRALSAHVDLSAPKETLDFGCGSGELARRFAQDGHHAFGFEPGGTYAAYAQGRGSVEIRCGGWREMDFAEESFDVITCLHVMEHLRDPVEALRRAASWLRPDGAMWVETPDMMAYGLKGFERLHFAHVLGFSGDAMALAGHRAGLEVASAFGPTSVVFRRGARAPDVDLSAMAAAVRSSYGGGTSWRDYAAHHGRRLSARIGRRLGFARN